MTGTADIHSQSTSKRSRRYILRAMAVVVGILPLVILEATLWIADLPKTASLFDAIGEANGSRKLFVLRGDGQRYETSAERLETFRPDSFPSTKSESVKRIFVLGGSTVQGRPYQPETAFSTWLRLTLESSDPTHPPTQWQVVNCGGVSYASYRVAAVLSEVLEYQPDLIVLYCGHNEFLERRSIGSLRSIPAFVAKPLSWGSRMRSVQVVANLFDATAETEPSLELLSREVDTLLDRGGLGEYSRQPQDRIDIDRAFIENIRAMVDACQQRSVKMIVCVPSSNLVDCPPFKAEYDDTLSPVQRERCRQLVQAASASDLSLAERMDLLWEAHRIDPQHATINFRLGRLAMQRGDLSAAKRYLQLACDNDVCPLRIRSSMTVALRDLIRQQQIPSVDVDDLFCSQRSDGLVGDNLMIDHVHPTIAGHQIIARAIFDCMVEQGWVTRTSDWERRRDTAYHQHLGNLSEAYFARGKQRLEGLRRWASGRAARFPVDTEE